MDYLSALSKILTLVDHEASSLQVNRVPRMNLDRISRFLELLGDPHTGIPTIHVAGTKGKGSTVAICASILAAHGYQTGMYTSPHLHTFRERMSLNLNPITENVFALLVEKIWCFAEDVGSSSDLGRVTVFEFLTAMAFYYFNDNLVDSQVVEVGLGGRLDATNVFESSIPIITAIDLDHTAILGDTITDIAREKCGIIKRGSKVISAPQTSEALCVLESVCAENSAELILVGRDVKWESGESSLEGQEFLVNGRFGIYKLFTPLLGLHQLDNAAVAVGAIEVFQEEGIDVSMEAIVNGIESVKWPCRMEILQNHPLIVADGAHNPFAIDVLLKAVKKYFQFKRIILVIGTHKDKDLHRMAKVFMPIVDVVIATQSRHPRAASLYDLKQVFADFDAAVTECDNVSIAIRRAIDIAENGDLILVTGSLITAAEAREEILNIPPEVYTEYHRDSKSTN